MTTVILLLCVVLATEAVPGQDDGPVFERIPPESGLSQNSINSIFQDRRGFLWVGTAEGLNRYDGYQFVTYRHDPGVPGSLSDNRVFGLFEDSEGILWVGTGNGADRLDQRTGRFTPLMVAGDRSNSRRDFSVWQILEDAAGTVWLATSAGVCRVEHDGLQGRMYPGPRAAHALHMDRSGTLWVFDLSRAEVYQYDTAIDRFLPAGITAPPGWPVLASFAGVHSGRTRTIWLTGSRGLATLDSARRQLNLVADGPGSNTIWEDPHGAAWLGGSGVVYQYVPATRIWRQFKLDTLTPTALNSVRVIYQDRAETLWVGTLGGLYRSDPHARHFSHRAHEPDNPASLSSSLVSAIHEDPDGVLWIGTIGGGLNRLDPLTGGVTRFRHNPRDPRTLSNDVVWALHEKGGRLWIGTDDGLNVLDRDTGRFRVIRCERGAGRGQLPNSVTSIVEDRQGVLWLGVFNGGLYRFDAKSSTCQPAATYDSGDFTWPELGSSVVSVDPSGSIWVGIDLYGLQRFDPATGQSKHYPFNTNRPEALTGRTVWAIHRSTAGVLWLGTEMGLTRFDPATETFTRFWDPALPSSVVYAIVEDGEHRLWLSTNRGIYSFDPKAPAGHQFKSFGTAEGLVNTEFNRRAALRSRDGRIFFGGLRGLTSFDPARVVLSNPIAPPVVLTELESRNRDGLRRTNALGLDRFVLSHNDYSFSFGFVALGFTNPVKNQYAYMLEGFDPDWVGPSPQRVAQYTNVPPGTYVFRVKGSNNDGVWNHQGASLRVTIVPPFWQRWWFRGLALGAVAGLLVLAHRHRVRQILAIERIRRQVATDLHDDVGSGLSQVAILSEVAKRDASPGGAALMSETANLARAMRESLSDIVWAVDPRKDRLADLVHRMRQVAFNALEADGLHVEFSAPADDELGRLGLPPDRRRHLLLIFKEATTNIMRHAHASHVWIDLTLQAGAVRLAIRDDGRGFDARRRFDGHGLQSLERRASELDARLVIDSTPGNGTIVWVSVPLK